VCIWGAERDEVCPAGGIAEFTNEGEFLAAAVSTEAYLGSCCPLFLLDSDTAAASADE
jgi:hypothetical protein